jgi:hypothetical protein
MEIYTLSMRDLFFNIRIINETSDHIEHKGIRHTKYCARVQVQYLTKSPQRAGPPSKIAAIARMLLCTCRLYLYLPHLDNNIPMCTKTKTMSDEELISDDDDSIYINVGASSKFGFFCLSKNYD